MSLDDERSENMGRPKGSASIYDDVEGSDHCPVGLELDI